MNGFNLSAINFAWLPILPLIAVAVGAMVVLLVGVRVEDEDSAGLGFIALVTLLAAFVLTLFLRELPLRSRMPPPPPRRED